MYKLTGIFATDYSDACGTNCFDLVNKVWSRDILNTWRIEPELFPDLYASTDVVGSVTAKASDETGLLQGTPVVIGEVMECVQLPAWALWMKEKLLITLALLHGLQRHQTSLFLILK